MALIVLPVGQDLGIHFTIGAGLPETDSDDVAVEGAASGGVEVPAVDGASDGEASDGAAVGADGEPTIDSMQIHLGRDVISIGADDYRTWLAAHDEPKRHAAGKFIRKSLTRVAAGETFGAEDPKSAMDRLFKEGLLVEFDLEKPASFLRQYRLIPTGRGFGTSPENPTAYRVGHPTQPLIEIDPNTYYLWSFSHRYGSMFAGCQAYAEESGILTLGQMCKSFVRQVPLLVASMCAYLDPEDAP